MPSSRPSWADKNAKPFSVPVSFRTANRTICVSTPYTSSIQDKTTTLDSQVMSVNPTHFAVTFPPLHSCLQSTYMPIYILWTCMILLGVSLHFGETLERWGSLTKPCVWLAELTVSLLQNRDSLRALLRYNINEPLMNDALCFVPFNPRIGCSTGPRSVC